MIQKTLFDTPAKISRKSDPTTSQQSAAVAEKELPRYQQELWAVLRALSQPVTAREAAQETSRRCTGMEDTYRKRMLDLVKRGLAFECGERQCRLTGKSAMTFTAKEQT